MVTKLPCDVSAAVSCLAALTTTLPAVAGTPLSSKGMEVPVPPTTTGHAKDAVPPTTEKLPPDATVASSAETPPRKEAPPASTLSAGDAALFPKKAEGAPPITMAFEKVCVPSKTPGANIWNVAESEASPTRTLPPGLTTRCRTVSWATARF
jgi:hypothetical protein